MRGSPRRERFGLGEQMSEQKSDIAIVGMSCVFPGAQDIRAYWNNILAKVDAVGDPPPDWGVDSFYDAESRDNDRTYCKRGGWLGELATFDPVALGVMPASVDGGEPDHFLALQAAHDALQDAGYDADMLKRFRNRTEVIIGRGTYVNRGNATAIQHVVGVESLLSALRKLHPEYSAGDLDEIRRELKASLPQFNSDTSAALVPNIISGRIANRLDLMGANYIVDAACASSLVAVDHAVRDLQSGRCDLAVAGGVHASTPPVILVIFSHLKALSRSGVIRPFDARADGTLLGEGVGMVVLKRLEDAERDCDRVYSVIKAVGVASDGRALGLLAPRLEGEVLAVERAYEEAGVSTGTVGLIEAHGTGTLVGDATELKALEAAFGERVGVLPDIAIGTVKSMISHTMPAAGIAGIIKTSLALHHKVLPPTICEEPGEALRNPKSRFYVNTEARPWFHSDTGAPRRAGVNAFGFGGINAHAVLEEYRGDREAPWLQTTWDSELFVLSGDSRPALAEAVRGLLDEVRESPETPLYHRAWRTNCTRELQRERVAIVATSTADLEEKLGQAIEKLDRPGVERIKLRGGVYYFSNRLADEGKLALMFPGEGSQYPNMLRELCLHFPEVRQVFELVDSAFQDHTRSRLPSQVVFPPTGQTDDPGLIWSMDAGAEAVFCANQAMLRLMEELGVRPDAVLGHSTGEHSALLASGVVRPSSEEEFIHHVLGVNRVFEGLKNRIPEATLVAVAGARREQLQRIVADNEGQLFVALDNCVNQVVLCGTAEGVETLIDVLSRSGAICQRLPMARAYHTPWFKVFSDPLRTYFDTVAVSAPSIPIYSCVTADFFPDDADAIRNLIAVSWSSTVRFRDSIEKMYADGVRIFVEAGPRGNLAGFVDDVLRGREHLAAPADIRTRSGITQLHHMLAQLTAHGVSPKLEYLYRRRAAEIVPKARSARRVRIASGLQPMRLSDTRGPSPPAEESASGDFVPVAAARQAETPIAGGSRTVPPAALAPPRDAPASHRPAPPQTPASADARAKVMQAHMGAMARFLDSQQQVVAAYVKRQGRSGNGVGTAPSPDFAPTPAAPAPFLDRVVALDDRSARATRRLSLDRDRLFLDHTLGRDVSEDDPSLTGLAVVPLTVTMEMLAEGAAILAPGLTCVGLSDVRASQWIAFDESTIELEVEAEALGDGEIRARIRRAGSPAEVRPTLAEAVVLFSASRTTGTTRRAALAGERPSNWRSDELYSKGMFHGRSFQAVRAMSVVAPTGCRAELGVPPRDGLIQGAPQPAFLLDPIALDAAGQVVAFWSQEELRAHADIFPYALEKLECFQQPPEPGTALECRVFVTRVDERTIVSDIEIVDRAGDLVYRLTGWADRRFSPPRGFWDLRIAPRSTFLSRPADGWLGSNSGDPDLACVTLEAFSEELYEASHGVWRRALAGMVLSRAERRRMAAWSANPAGCRQWITGLIAVKDATRRLLQRRFGAAPAYADITVDANGDGGVSVSGEWRQRWNAAVRVALASSDVFAAAVASLDASRPVGIAIEPGELDLTAAEAPTLTPDEQRVLDTLNGSDRKQWARRLRCAKQAAASSAPEALPGPMTADRVNVVTGEALLASPDGGTRYTSHTGAEGPVVFAVVTEKPWKK